MHLKAGDRVELRLDEDEYVEGKVVDADFPDIFSEGWTILALVTEGGHSRYGQAAPFGASEVTFKEVPA